jgi:hypothetical protein
MSHGSRDGAAAVHPFNTTSAPIAVTSRFEPSRFSVCRQHSDKIGAVCGFALPQIQLIT